MSVFNSDFRLLPKNVTFCITCVCGITPTICVVRTVFQMFLDTRSGTNGRAGICCGTFLSREVTQYLYDTRCSSSEPPYPLLVSQLVDPDALRTSDSSRVHTQILAHDMN